MLKPAKPEIKSENNQNQACLADRDTPFLFHRKLYSMKLHKKYHLGDRT